MAIQLEANMKSNCAPSWLFPFFPTFWFSDNKLHFALINFVQKQKPV